MRTRPTLAILPLFLLLGCDKIDDPYPEGEDEAELEGCELQTDGEFPATRIVLIEDYTGHTCGNCPAAALEAEALKDQYGEEVVVAAVHSGYFAEPGSEEEGEPYSTDFRTEAGEEYNDHFNVDNQGLPQGMISRTEWNGDRVLGPSEWSNAVDSLVGDSVDASLQVDLDYNENEGRLCAEVVTRLLNPLEDTLSMNLYLLEDSVIDWQTNYSTGGDPSYPSPDAEEYQHEHVLRAVINGTWGDRVLEGQGSAGEEQRFSYSHGVADEWKVEDLSVIAYIYDENQERVIQAVSRKLEYEP